MPSEPARRSWLPRFTAACCLWVTRTLLGAGRVPCYLLGASTSQDSAVFLRFPGYLVAGPFLRRLLDGTAGHALGASALVCGTRKRP